MCFLLHHTNNQDKRTYVETEYLITCFKVKWDNNGTTAMNIFIKVLPQEIWTNQYNHDNKW